MKAGLWSLILAFALLCASATIATAAVLACSSRQTSNRWVENPSNPIYIPFITSNMTEDYYPDVLYDDNLFNGNGDAYLYKMWHQGENDTIWVSFSNDGVIWFNPTITDLPEGAVHISVLYNVNSFGGGSYVYKAWYSIFEYTTNDAGCMFYAYSNDGVSWDQQGNLAATAPDLIHSPVSFETQFNMVCYGPGRVYYSPTSTGSSSTNPYSSPYVMLFETASPDEANISEVAESIGVAYSDDGINWTRYSQDLPVFMRSGTGVPSGPGIETATLFNWDGSTAYRPSLVIDDNGIYHLFYSSSNFWIHTEDFAPPNFLGFGGIGHASSRDGITWSRDPENPIFHFSNGQDWRGGRTSAASVLYNNFGGVKKQWKMWYSGGPVFTNTGEQCGIGYATLQPFTPAY